MSKENRIIMLHGEIKEETAKDVIERILEINFEDDKKDKTEKNFERKPIQLVLNSFGGSTYNCFAIVSAIKRSKSPIHIYVDGYAMSAGLAITVVGQKRFASKYAQFMFHQSLASPSGALEDIRTGLEQSDNLQSIYVEILTSNSDISKERMNETIHQRKNWYFGASEALEMKIIDEIIEF